MTDPSESIFEEADLVSVFPTFVWNFQLQDGSSTAINRQLGALIAEQRQGLAALAECESWQSSRALHDLDACQGLVTAISAAAKNVLDFLRVGDDEVVITGCWANVNAPQAVHGMHSHPNNYLSGVYYLQTPAGADTINFHDPRAQTGIIRPPVTELTAHNTDQAVVRVRNGTLLMFPSYMQHSVSANVSAGERISVSFNIMFSSFTEQMSKPLW